MQTRREIIKSGLGLAGIIAAGQAPAAIIRSLSAARAALTGGKKSDPAYWGLCFTAEQAGSTVAMNWFALGGTAPNITLLYSIDAITWNNFATDGSTVVTLDNIGDKVWFRAGVSGNISLGNVYSSGYRFVMQGRISASGNVMSLLDGNDESSRTLLGDSNFASLFRGCTSLVSAPELPATTLTDGCYDSVFYGCTSLVSAPELPATTLVDYCYINMFHGCTSLVSAPELPATTLAKDGCYNRMFQGCSALNYIKVGFESWVVNSTAYWIDGVATTGTFVCPAALGTQSSIKRGALYCPIGWTVVNT